MLKQSIGNVYETFKVMLYADPVTRLRTSYVRDALKRDLARKINDLPTELIDIPCRHDFAQAIQTINPNVIIIPENQGSISYHMRDFSTETIKALKKNTYLGGTTVMFGGASHYAIQKIVWHWDDETIIYKGGAQETFGFVAGKIVGPHIRHPRTDDAHIAHNGCFKVPLLIPNGNTMMSEKCWQGNCGSFIINDQRVQAGTRDLAYYTDGQVAAVDVPYGTKGGNFILCSVMPHYKPRCQSPLWDEILTMIETKKYGVSCKPTISIKL